MLPRALWIRPDFPLCSAQVSSATGLESVSSSQWSLDLQSCLACLLLMISVRLLKPRNQSQLLPWTWTLINSECKFSLIRLWTWCQCKLCCSLLSRAPLLFGWKGSGLLLGFKSPIWRSSSGKDPFLHSRTFIIIPLCCISCRSADNWAISEVHASNLQIWKVADYWNKPKIFFITALNHST